MNPPVISLIIATYNSEATLEAALDSIIKQRFHNYEVIIVDGISVDKTLEIIKSFSIQYPAIKWISEKDEGVYDAMNKGIKIASGEYLYFLGSDDYLINDRALCEVYEGIKENNFPDFAYGNVFWGNGNRVYDGEYDIYKLCHSNICHQAIFYKKSLFERLGLYDKQYPSLADYHFNFKCFSDPSVSKQYLPLMIARYATDGVSSNHNDPLRNTRYEVFKKLAKSAPAYQYFKVKKVMTRTDSIKGKADYFLYHLLYHFTDVFRRISGNETKNKATGN